MRTALFIGLVLATFAADAVAAGTDRKCSGPICVIVDETPTHADLYVSVNGAAPVTLTFAIATVNAEADVPASYTRSFSGSRAVRAFSIRSLSPGPWKYRYRYRWAWGTVNADHDARHSYRLPYDSGGEHRVSQGFNGTFTHNGDAAYAVDFKMPVGTRVRAAREGVVVEVVDHFTVGGNDPALKSQANEVKIVHSDGTIGRYLHLSPKLIVVRPGQRVRAGDLIAHSGSTGYTRGPHLHFEVYRRSDAERRKTLPIRFTTAEGDNQTLQAGQTYRAP